jgi:hypothetical protein
MMNTVKRRVKIGEDGLLRLEMPAGSANTEIEVVLSWQPVSVSDVDDNGWPIGFFDRTYGALADDPMDEIEQLPPEERDEIE